jgi:hypothetical protein
VKFFYPLCASETVHCTTEVFRIVESHHKALNQDDKLVAERQRKALIRRRRSSRTRSLSGEWRT